MKRVLFFMCVPLVLLCASPVSAFDWKSLHETADRIDLRTAMHRVESNPQSAEDLYILGLVYLDLFQSDKAEETFERLLRSSPGMPGALWGKAEVLRRRHEFARAETILSGIQKEAPEYWPAYVTMAYIRFIQTKFHASANFALAVMRRDLGEVDLSTYTRAHIIYAGAKGMIAHYGGPVSRFINGFVVFPTLQEAQALKPDSPEVLYGLGCYYLLTPRGLGKNIRLAKYYLERLVNSEPYFSDGFARLAQVYKINGDERKYEAMLGQALTLDPESELAIDIKNRTCRFICPERNGD